LFGYLKGKLSGQFFETLSGLSAAVGEILADISLEIWSSVFEEWTRRLEECIQREGEYVE
jgi:hypothetical protein